MVGIFIYVERGVDELLKKDKHVRMPEVKLVKVDPDAGKLLFNIPLLLQRLADHIRNPLPVVIIQLTDQSLLTFEVVVNRSRCHAGVFRYEAHWRTMKPVVLDQRQGAFEYRLLFLVEVFHSVLTSRID